MQMLQARTGGPALHHCYAPATPVDQITYLPACLTQGRDPRDPGKVPAHVVAQSASLPKHNFPARHLLLFWPARRARP